MRRPGFWENVFASLAAAGLLGLGSWLVAHYVAKPSSALVGALAAGAAVASLGYGAFLLWRPHLLRRVSYLSRPAVDRRIAAAKKEIWTFQISGGEFTAEAVASYETWLRQDPDRRLRLLFANPENGGLLESIARLSGRDKFSSEPIALDYLRETINTSLKRYAELSARLPGQVEIRTYDCSPPCSIHAVDACDSEHARSSLFVELYLPDLPWHARPCVLLGRRHPLYALYRDQCLVWFKDSDVWASSSDASDEIKAT